MTERGRKIAAIDVGTNSIHMIVAEVRDGAPWRVVDREKDMVQLGLASLDGQPLTDAAMDRAIASLQRMSALSKRWQVEELHAVATSAVREAPNRRDFLRRVKDETGIRLRVISGEEEADYIYRAVRGAVDIGESTALCIDVGGGSTEFIAGTDDEVFFTASEKLGSLRLSQQFSLIDRASDAAIAACRAHVRDHAARLAKRVRRIGIDITIGTSGTIQALAAVCCGDAEAGANGLKPLSREALSSMLPRLAALSAADRAKQFNVDEKRAATLVGGAVAIDEILTLLGSPSLLACPAAMREGIIESRAAQLARTSKGGGSLRRRSVLTMAQRTEVDLRHANHVARLALRIFDQSAEVHGLDGDARELLQYAALLHESGLHISDRGHHKHTYYLIRHGDLRGFTDDQLLVLANTARYYRKSAPDEADPNFMELNAEQQERVRKLAAILRIAEGLDRGHRQRVRDVALELRQQRVRFIARTRTNADVELESAGKRARYFASLFDRRVKFETLS
ncbi:MAG TPA: Ppx/GppA phosphatase family protein [Thermoanaerobaculia bacterium]|nr:Ppx/GppA phosphatase family protein [Thermoanaerobaculia bacterium]